MSVLDYLLPKSFMSDVQTTFRPKTFEYEGFFKGTRDFIKILRNPATFKKKN